MWKYCILDYKTNEYVLQIDEAGMQVGSDISVAEAFGSVDKLHEYAAKKCKFKLGEYGVVGFYE